MEKIKELNEDLINRILKQEGIKKEEQEYYESVSEVCHTNLNINLDDAKKYKSIIFGKGTLSKHFLLCRALKEDEYLKNYQKEKSKKDFEVHITNNELTKVMFCRKLEKELGIDFLDVEKVKKLDDEVQLKNETWKYYQKLFRSEAKKPETRKELLKTLVRCYKQLFGSDIIDSEVIVRKHPATKKGGKRKSYKVIKYSVNEKKIKKHLALYKHKDDEMTHIRGNIRKRFNLPPNPSPEKKEKYRTKDITADLLKMIDSDEDD